MKFVYILTALVGLGLATWVAVMVIAGVRNKLRKGKNPYSSED